MWMDVWMTFFWVLHSFFWVLHCADDTRMAGWMAVSLSLSLSPFFVSMGLHIHPSTHMRCLSSLRST